MARRLRWFREAMIINIETGTTEQTRRSTPGVHPFLGPPVISNRRCPKCGSWLFGHPRWHEVDGGGWIEYDVRCAYRCEAKER